MFRKIVSNLPYSPALVGQLGFYAKRLRKEELTRRLGLIFTALALVVQSFAVFQPPEAANAASSADFVKGGVSSVSDFLNYYDRNSNNIKTLYTSLGITRAEIKAAKQQTIGEKGYYNWSMTSLYSQKQGQRSYTFYSPDGSSKTVYYRPMTLTQQGGPTHKVYVGHSKKFGWFAIKKDCGNLVTKKEPPKATKPATACDTLKVATLNPTRFRFTAKATKQGAATIKDYTFIVRTKDDGKEIHRKSVKSNKTTATYDYTRTTPGAYYVTVRVGTSLGTTAYDSDCRVHFKVAQPPKKDEPKPKSAVCSSLQARIIGRTNVELTGAASVENATISKYTFVIKDKSGKVISTKAVSSTATKVIADAVVIETPGDYTSQVTVTTSLGNKTDPTDCVAKFTIAPPAVCPVDPKLPVNSPDCQPCPDPNAPPNTPINSPECEAEVVQKKTAINLDEGNKVASTILAKPSQRISYTITVTNKGYVDTKAPIQEKLEDVLEYAALIDLGGGIFDQNTKTLTWPDVTIKPGVTETRTFVVQLASSIPATNTGTSNASSYDCRMTNTFGNEVEIDVTCPTEKVIVEQVVSELPHTGPAENMIFAAVLLTIVTYFYTRSRQMGKEVRLIRKNLHAGTI